MRVVAHLHKKLRLPLPDSGVTLAVIADTHSAPHPRSLALVAEQKPDYILHGGDIGDLGVLEPFAQIAPLVVVRGNIDGRGADLPDHITIEAREDTGPALRILLTHIAVGGTRLRANIRRLAQRERADLVVCGHSHMPLLARDSQIGIFNPGSIGPRRFLLPITFGVIRFSPSGVSFRHIDCETGQRWLPVLALP
jgi:putative phosphoesterase